MVSDAREAGTIARPKYRDSMPGRKDTTPMAAVVVQHTPASAARHGERAAQATNSGASPSHAAIVHDSGGKAAARTNPDRAARRNAPGPRTSAARSNTPTPRMEAFDEQD